MKKKRIVVCGATGQQGGGVVRNLLKSEQFQVVGLSRNPDSEKSRALSQQGVEVVRADLDDEPSLVRAFEGADGVFGVTQPFTSDYKKCNPAKEVAQGTFIANACVTTGIAHLVLSTVFVARNRDEMLSMEHVASKFEVEDVIAGKSIPTTILRPVAFMDMIGTMDFMPVKDNSTAGMVGKHVRMPFVHTDDLGAIARIAFEDPQTYIGKEIGLVSDFFTGAELAAEIGKLVNKPKYKYRCPPTFVLWLVSKLGLMLDEFYYMHLIYTDWGTAPHPPSIQAAIEVMDEVHDGRVTVQKYLRDYLGLQP